MSQIATWAALTVIGGLFLLIGVQPFVYAQGNDTSMGNTTMGNSTTWAANATSAGNMTGNISSIPSTGG